MKRKYKYTSVILLVFMAMQIILPVAAWADSPSTASTATATTATAECPSGKCKTEAAEWVPGVSVTASTGGSKASTTFVKDVPVSKLKSVKKSWEKRHHVVVGYYQNPEGFQGSSKSCTDPEKHSRWNFHAGDFYKTTNHLREPMPPARWQKGDKICNWHIVKKGHRYWVVGVQEVCSNVKSELPIGNYKIPKPKVVYEQFPTVQKFWEVATKHTEIKSEAETGGAGSTGEVEGHWTCRPGGVLNGTSCKYCPPPSCEPPPCTSCEPEPCTSCEPEPCNTCKEPPRVENVYKIQEVYTDEPIQFCADVYAPPGDNLKILFVTEYGTFSPREIKIASYGSQSHFCTTYTAPSEPVFDHVHVFVQDNTTGKTCKSPDQLVEVQSREENPS